MTPHPYRFLRLSALLGVAGGLLILIVAAVVSLGYAGANAEPYSFANHFISELGQVGVSRLAWLYNAGLIASGILFIPFSIGLGVRLRGVLGYAGMAAGIGAGIFCAGVGVFPMNDLDPHTFVAMWFFRLGLVMMVVFAIAVLATKRGRERAGWPVSLFSLVAVMAFAAFLALAGAPHGGADKGVNPGTNPLDNA
jgi:hypothetical membrane protein